MLHTAWGCPSRGYCDVQGNELLVSRGLFVLLTWGRVCVTVPSIQRSNPCGQIIKIEIGSMKTESIRWFARVITGNIIERPISSTHFMEIKLWAQSLSKVMNTSGPALFSAKLRHQILSTHPSPVESTSCHKGQVPVSGLAWCPGGQLGRLHALFLVLWTLPRTRLPHGHRKYWLMFTLDYGTRLRITVEKQLLCNVSILKDWFFNELCSVTFDISNMWPYRRVK